MTDNTKGARILLEKNAQAMQKAMAARLNAQAQSLFQLAEQTKNGTMQNLDQTKSTCEALAMLTTDTEQKAAYQKAAAQVKDMVSGLDGVFSKLKQAAETMADISKALQSVQISLKE